VKPKLGGKETEEAGEDAELMPPVEEKEGPGERD